MNKVILVGRVGSDPDGSDKYVKFSLATSEKQKKGDKWEDVTEWHNIVSFFSVPFIKQYVKKGDIVSIEGKIQTSKYDKNGEVRYSTSIISEKLNLISKYTQKENTTKELDELPWN